MARRYRCTAGRVAVLVAVVVLLGCGFALNLWLTCGHARGCVTRALVKQSHAALPAHAALTAKVGQQQAQHVVSAVAPLSTPVSTSAASASARVSSTSTVAAQQASFEALGVALSVQGSEARAASTNTTAAPTIIIAELASRVGGRMRSLMKEFKERLACAKKDNTFKGAIPPQQTITNTSTCTSTKHAGRRGPSRRPSATRASYAPGADCQACAWAMMHRRWLHALIWDHERRLCDCHVQGDPCIRLRQLLQYVAP